MIDKDFLTKKIKEKGFKWSEIAELMGVQYQTIYKNLNKNSLDTLRRISEVTGIRFAELLPAPQGYIHIYENGDWLGIIKKPQIKE